jgi:hypothetical protein
MMPLAERQLGHDKLPVSDNHMHTDTLGRTATRQQWKLGSALNYEIRAPTFEKIKVVSRNANALLDGIQ